MGGGLSDPPTQYAGAHLVSGIQPLKVTLNSLMRSQCFSRKRRARGNRRLFAPTQSDLLPTPSDPYKRLTIHYFAGSIFLADVGVFSVIETNAPNRLVWYGAGDIATLNKSIYRDAWNFLLSKRLWDL